ncbi:hypothetical protein AB0C12_21865 [Actinoplanes sp. NPDC048967]|uniref:hypothetical protein n=1 Tax=Actinoplanes sp. NPDC048967 TaxID=3155269 RepID=UPI0033CB80EA
MSPKEGASLAGITPAGRLIAYAQQAVTVSIDPATGAADWETGSYGPARPCSTATGSSPPGSATAASSTRRPGRSGTPGRTGDT